MRGRLGIGYAITLALALAITMTVAAIAIYGYMLSGQSAAGAAIKEAEEGLREAYEKISLVYWIGGKLALKNYGDIPVAINYIFTDQGLYSGCSSCKSLQPGEICTCSDIPGSRKLGIVTSSGSIIILRDRGAAPSSGGGQATNAAIKITGVEVRAPSDEGNARILRVKVRNTGSVKVLTLSIVYVGESGRTQADAIDLCNLGRCGGLDPGEEIKIHEVLLMRDDWGSGVYIRAVGFCEGGIEVSDATWVNLG